MIGVAAVAADASCEHACALMRAHGSDALDMLTLASVLHRRFDQAGVRGTALLGGYLRFLAEDVEALAIRTGLRGFLPSAVPDVRLVL